MDGVDERAVLQFERDHPAFDQQKAEAARSELGMTVGEYGAALVTICAAPPADLAGEFAPTIDRASRVIAQVRAAKKADPWSFVMAGPPLVTHRPHRSRGRHATPPRGAAVVSWFAHRGAEPRYETRTDRVVALGTQTFVLAFLVYCAAWMLWPGIFPR